MPAITPAIDKTIQHHRVRSTRTYEVRNAGYFGKPIKNGTKNLYDAKIVEKFIADWQAGKIAIPPRKKRDNEKYALCTATASARTVLRKEPNLRRWRDGSHRTPRQHAISDEIAGPVPL